MGRLTLQHIVQWTNIKTDLYTDDRLMTFGICQDLLNQQKWYYCKYPDNTYKKLGDNVFGAIDQFNELSPPEEV